MITVAGWSALTVAGGAYSRQMKGGACVDVHCLSGGNAISNRRLSLAPTAVT